MLGEGDSHQVLVASVDLSMLSYRNVVRMQLVSCTE